MRSGNEVSALLAEFFEVVKKQIDVGLRMARTAELEHAKSNWAFGSRAARSAVRIYRGLRTHLDNPYLGHHRSWVAGKLRELDSMLDGLRRKYSLEVEEIA